MDQMMQEIIREEFEQEDASALAPCLCQTLHSQFEPSILPQELDEELVWINAHSWTPSRMLFFNYWLAWLELQLLFGEAENSIMSHGYNCLNVDFG